MPENNSLEKYEKCYFTHLCSNSLPSVKLPHETNSAHSIYTKTLIF